MTSWTRLWRQTRHFQPSPRRCPRRPRPPPDERRTFHARPAGRLLTRVRCGSATPTRTTPPRSARSTTPPCRTRLWPGPRSTSLWRPASSGIEGNASRRQPRPRRRDRWLRHRFCFLHRVPRCHQVAGLPLHRGAHDSHRRGATEEQASAARCSRRSSNGPPRRACTS